MKGANLDINACTLVFEHPGLYYLDLNLKYKCDPDQGNAKFDKSKKTLTIRLPVVGLTEDSQAVLDANYQKHVVEREAMVSELQVQGEQDKEEAEAARAKEEEEKNMTPEEKEQRDMMLKKLEEMQSHGGMGQSKKQLMASHDLEGNVIQDKYGIDQEVDIYDDDDEDDVEKDEGSSFLKVYKEGEDKPAEGETETAASSEIQFRRPEDDDMDLKLPGAADEDGNKPLIQEMGSTTFTGKQGRKKQAKAKEIVKPKFNWDTAEKIDAQFQFMNQGELVFVNFNFKGYSKETDIRYALSENEILLEVRDEAKNKVHRVCKTLCNPINSQESSVQLLVDFIIFKLKKDEKHKKTWDDLGYDIKEFHIPESSNSYMRSNFLR